MPGFYHTNLYHNPRDVGNISKLSFILSSFRWITAIEGSIDRVDIGYFFQWISVIEIPEAICNLPILSSEQHAFDHVA